MNETEQELSLLASIVYNQLLLSPSLLLTFRMRKHCSIQVLIAGSPITNILLFVSDKATIFK